MVRVLDLLQEVRNEQLEFHLYFDFFCMVGLLLFVLYLLTPFALCLLFTALTIKPLPLRET